MEESGRQKGQSGTGQVNERRESEIEGVVGEGAEEQGAVEVGLRVIR